MHKSFQKPSSIPGAIGFSVEHVQNIFPIVSVRSVLSANHLQSWSRPAESPLPAHAGQAEEEDRQGGSPGYIVSVVLEQNIGYRGQWWLGLRSFSFDFFCFFADCIYIYISSCQQSEELVLEQRAPSQQGTGGRL